VSKAPLKMLTNQWLLLIYVVNKKVLSFNQLLELGSRLSYIYHLIVMRTTTNN